jgi:Ca-activated chloride channel family protein
MARHVLRTGDESPRWVVPGLVASFAIAATVALVVSVGGDPRSLLARAPVVGDECPSSSLSTTRIAVVAAPDIAPTVRRIITPLLTQKLSNGHCLDVALTAQDPAETVAGAQILPVDRAPQLWIPDSALWVAQLQRWKPEPVASFASSPVVMASSRPVIEKLGWDDQAPTWDAAMGGQQAVAAPNIAQDAAGLSATIALWQALGKGDKAQQGLAAAVLAGLRAGAPSRGDALTAAQEGSQGAPVIPVTEKTVRDGSDEAGKSELTAVYPDGGSPSLDYPVTQVNVRPLDENQQVAVKAVTDALKAPEARTVVRADGFRDSTGATEKADGIPVKVEPLQPPAQAEISAVLTRVIALSAPSRVLVVIDISGSMRAPAGNGMDRVTFAGAATIAAGNFMPDVAQVGLWGFARNLKAGQDRIQFFDVAELGSREGSISRKEAVERALLSMPRRVGGDGTTLYETAVAAMKKMNSLYDPRAGNAVVLFTDGKNDDENSPSLQQTVKQLKELYDPRKPVRLIGVGIGPDADIPALKAMANTTGGGAYQPKDPKQLPQILFDVMSRRPKV